MPDKAGSSFSEVSPGTDVPVRTRRKRRKKKKRDILIFFVLIVSCSSFIAFLFSPFCHIGSVEITGTGKMDVETVCRVGHIDLPLNLLRVNTATVADNLRKDLRVASATAERQWWPPKLVVSITGNRIMAYAYSNYGLVSLDKNGVVIAAQKSFSNYDAPLLCGVKLADEYVGEPSQNKTVLGAVKFLGELDASTFDQVSEVDIGNVNGISLLLNNGIVVRLGDFERSAEKAAHLKHMIKEIAEKNFAISQIDLKFEPPTMRVKQ